MKRVKSLKELQDAFVDVNNGVSDDTIFSAKAVLFMAEQLVALRGEMTRKKRPPTAYVKFVSQQMKRGATLTQAASAWRESKKP